MDFIPSKEILFLFHFDLSYDFLSETMRYTATVFLMIENLILLKFD